MFNLEHHKNNKLIYLEDTFIPFDTTVHIVRKKRNTQKYKFETEEASGITITDETTSELKTTKSTSVTTSTLTSTSVTSTTTTANTSISCKFYKINFKKAFSSICYI